MGGGSSLPEGLDQVVRTARTLKRRLPRFVDIDDLIGAGCLGLLKASRAYQPAAASFSTYAHRWILGAMMDEVNRLHQRDPLREPLRDTQSAAPAFGSVDHWDEIEALLRPLEPRARGVLWARLHGYEHGEIGEALGVSASRVCQIQRNATEWLNLQQTVPGYHHNTGHLR